MVDNCGAKLISTADYLDIRLIFSNDFTVTKIHKNLVLATPSWTQRFEMILEIDQKAIALANYVTNFNPLPPLTTSQSNGKLFTQLMPLMRICIYAVLLGTTMNLVFAIDASYSHLRVS